ncbi:PREDICTED: uncharacterized protein LOC104817106 [Tarenaya hassleriana]|uniref:uncharacterized protein LOC104817106 n=1 Tax=Tarenaya hassleriana TaxID=28532 RepID=UPI00053C2B97|nr:PREDICTED: uncharacterized protein LOC104817106 [Tarenaya hassleriana]
MIGNKLRRFNPAWFDQYNGFSSWNKTERLASHVDDVNSFHNNARKKCDDLMRQSQSIIHAMHKQSDTMKNEYRIRLNASISSSRYLLNQGLPFRGHDELEISDNKGNFLELVKYTAEQNEGLSKMAVVFRFVDKNGIVKERFIDLVHVKETSALSLMSAIDSLFAKHGLSLKKVKGQGYDGASNMKVLLNVVDMMYLDCWWMSLVMFLTRSRWQ